MGEECPCGWQVRTPNSREEISAFSAEGRARSYAARFPIPVRVVLRIVGADEYMELSVC